MADFLYPSPNLLHREAVSELLRREAVDTSCTDLIPGLRKLQSGVDGSKLDLISLTPNEPEDGFRAPVVYFTCKEGKKKKIPPKKGNNSYDEPDQIQSVSPIHAGYSSNKASVMKSRSDVSDFISANGGIKGLGLFKLSGSYARMTSTVEDKNKSVADSEKHEPVFNVRMLPAISLKMTSHMEKFIEKRLNKPFREDAVAYRDFIAQWGTHFFHKADFGGIIRVVMEMDSSFTKTQTEDSIGVQASGIIEGIEIKGGFEKESKSMNEEFKKHTSVTKRILGGDYDRFVKEGYNGWKPTVAENPWLYKGKLLQIHHLFKDQTKADEMREAIEMHMRKALLQSACKMAGNKLPSLTGDQFGQDKKLQSYIDKCNKLMYEDFPEFKDVNELNREIEMAMLWKKKDCEGRGAWGNRFPCGQDTSMKWWTYGCKRGTCWSECGKWKQWCWSKAGKCEGNDDCVKAPTSGCKGSCGWR